MLTMLTVSMVSIISRWTSLPLFLDDGRIEMDTNTVERSIRRRRLPYSEPTSPPCEGRSHHGFIGQEEESVGVIAGFVAGER